MKKRTYLVLILLALFALGIWWGLSKVGQALQFAAAVALTAVTVFEGFALLPLIVTVFVFAWAAGLLSSAMSWFGQSKTPPGGISDPVLNTTFGTQTTAP
jgi:hypothetical protein